MFRDIGLGGIAEAITAFGTLAIVVLLRRHAILFRQQAYALGASVKAFEDSDTETRKSRQQELRAYIHIEEAGMSKLNTGYSPDVVLTIKNFGRTPAYDMCYWSKFEFIEPNSNPEISRDASFRPLTDMPPDGNVVIVNDLVDSLTMEQHRGFVSNNLHGFLYGEVRYADAFENIHSTKFQMKVSVDGYWIKNANTGIELIRFDFTKNAANNIST